MAFFGFDTSLPRDRGAPSGSRGMFESHDPFAGLSKEGGNDEDEILNFDDTYDGLGHQLNESGDTFNDDTFGADQPVTRQAMGRDFDFAGETAKVRGDLLEEQALHHLRQPPMQQQQQQQYQQQYNYNQRQAPRPAAKTGYEAYQEPEYIPKLEADASIWGKPMGKQSQQQQAQQDQASSRKMMSLEEVEAMMRNQAPKQQPQPTQAQDFDMQSQGLRNMLGVGGPPPMAQQQQQQQPQILQRPPPQQQMPEQNMRGPQILQREQPRPQQQDMQQQQMNFQQQGPPQMPMGAPPVQPPRGPMQQQQMGHQRGPSYNGPPITQAQQMMNMNPEERETYLAEEAKRAKRNHKIFMLSKNNGLMTPQDKNFITRIQLQQLLTATGGIDNDIGSEEQLAEDFYYQVYAQIRGPPRSGPGQPLNQFAQTYLFQTGSRYGYGRSRHHPRGGDNHVQRMEQQVARAVEAAKARPKNKQLVVEGSLGKIAFSNSKTPRPLLNFKRPDTASKHQPAKASDRKQALRDIEKMYSTLMRLEDHERHLPRAPTEDSPPDVIEGHMKWRSEMQLLNEQLWDSLRVLDNPANPSMPHPFIQIISHSKGKKAIPRVFRHLDEQQRLTMLTLIVIHMDVLDVIRDAYPPADNTPIPQRVKEEVELFSQAIMPPLFSYINEAPLNIITGLLGLILDRVHVQSVIRTKIGISILTTLISRAELVKQATSTFTATQQEEWQQWSDLYSRLFDAIEPMLPYLFPTDTGVQAADDVHVWQFLAAMGIGASQDQQQRLVLGVKDRVMETVHVSKTLPTEMAERRTANVNLFMHAIGLDVDLLR